MTQSMVYLGECFISMSSEYVFSCCWLKCSPNVTRVSLLNRVGHSSLIDFPFVLSIIEREAPKSSIIAACLSLVLVQAFSAPCALKLR